MIFSLVLESCRRLAFWNRRRDGDATKPCCGLTPGFLGTRRYFIARLCWNDFNRITTADLAGLDNAAENSAPPAQRFLKSLPDGVHLVAGLAFLGDFQQSFAGANPLSHGQGLKLDAARSDVFLHSPGDD